jgi:serine/threonine protein kinase
MSLQPGSILQGRYSIERQLGKEGGMGAVYLAHDKRLNQPVAVKENLNINPESERQFYREATLLAELRHPNLPRVTDYFILEDKQYLVMDFIAGEDLHTRAQNKPPTVEEVLEWADAVCSALTYLHHRKPPVIHRDIKPANLKLKSDGTIVLVDFGLAKTFDQAQTTTGARGLTPGFSPPEQYGAQRTDTSSDQYSLGATLYNLLTGQRPTDSIERVLKKVPLKSARTLNPAVPEHVDAAIQTSLELKQSDRFQDIETFRAALQGKLRIETTRAPTRPAAPRRRIRTGRILLGGALVVALMVVGVVIAFQGGLPGSRPETSPSSTEALVVAVQPSSTFTQTPTWTSTTPPPTPTITSTPTITPSPTLVPSPTPLPIGGGGRIAFVSDRAEGILQIWTMNPDGSDPRQLTFGPGDKTQPKWSPDGSRLLYVTPGGMDNFGNELGLDIKIIRADGTEIAWVTHNPGDDTDPAWSPDGSLIAFTSTRINELRQVYVLDASCLEQPAGCVSVQPRNISCSPDFCAVEYAPAWSPLGFSHPSWLPSNYNIAVATSINQAPAQIYFHPPEPEPTPIDFDRGDRIVSVDHLEWAPDGSGIVFTWFYQRGTNEIFFAPFNDRGATYIKLTDGNGNKEPSISPDGNWIIFTSTREQNPEIYLMTANGANEVNITHNPARDMQPDWQPPGG